MLLAAWCVGWERNGVGAEQGRSFGVQIWRTKGETALGGHWRSLKTTCVLRAFHLPRSSDGSRKPQTGGVFLQGWGGRGGLGGSPGRAWAAL